MRRSHKRKRYAPTAVPATGDPTPAPLPALTRLVLAENEIGDAGAGALAKSVNASRLETLGLVGNPAIMMTYIFDKHMITSQDGKACLKQCLFTWQGGTGILLTPIV